MSLDRLYFCSHIAPRLSVWKFRSQKGMPYIIAYFRFFRQPKSCRIPFGKIAIYPHDIYQEAGENQTFYVFTCLKNQSVFGCKASISDAGTSQHGGQPSCRNQNNRKPQRFHSSKCGKCSRTKTPQSCTFPGFCGQMAPSAHFAKVCEPRCAPQRTSTGVRIAAKTSRSVLVRFFTVLTSRCTSG